MKEGLHRAGLVTFGALWLTSLDFLAAQTPPPISVDPVAPLARIEVPRARIARLELRVEADSADVVARWMLAQEYATLASTETDAELALALAYAGRAHGLVSRSLAPDSLPAHYWLAVASGLAADLEQGRARIRLAEEAYRESGWVLERDSLHAGAHLLRGRIHRAAMRLSPVTRFLAKIILGGEVLGEASWDRAETHLSRAAELESVPLHHFSLAELYRDTGRAERVPPELQRALQAPGDRPIDELYRARARAELEAMGLDSLTRRGSPR